ncbi:MAG: hypothetical protein K5767_06735 [Clostridia bacterium]|nr:hypothetical protein [Clostridia bacterium]
MKKAKKLVALGLCVVMTMMAFAACGGKDMSNSKFCGKWVASTAVASGLELSADEIYEDGFIIDLGKDGTCTVTVEGQSESGSWDETQDGKSITVDGLDDFNFSINEDNPDILVLDYAGVIINFAKQ